MAAAAVDSSSAAASAGCGAPSSSPSRSLLFGLWYLGWGHDAESHLSLRNVLVSPRYVVEGLAASLESLLGLATRRSKGRRRALDWGQPLLVAIALVVVRQIRRPGFSPGSGRCWRRPRPTGSSPPSTRSLAASRAPAATCTPAAVFTLLLAAELLRDVRFSRKALTIIGVVTVAAVASNIHFFKDGSDC